MSRHQYLLVSLLLIVQSAFGGEIFVDNIDGHDADDGTIPVARQGRAGPVRSFARATELATFGDTIVIKNTGKPYYESISLTGRRHSGDPTQPFVIAGNGATISGLRSVPREGWRNVGPKLWKLTLTRKGYYQLLRDGQLLTEYIPEEGVKPLDTLPMGQWVSWHGSLYFRQDGVETPDYQAFAVTSDQTGISLHQVSNVLIVDVTLQHFRFDGIHAQGLCNNIELDNVRSIENGRAGVVSSGASRVDIFGGEIVRNGRHQILVEDRSRATAHVVEAQQ